MAEDRAGPMMVQIREYRCEDCGRLFTTRDVELSGRIRCGCAHEPVDLGDAGAFDELIRTSEAIPTGEVWVGPGESDPMRAFGPGTTDGGRAEAGWQLIGTVTEDGIVLKPHGLSPATVADLVEHQDVEQ